MPEIAITPEIRSLLAVHTPVAIGVSGGKDSVACALATAQYLDQMNHLGPKILVHSDLGMVEWADSAPSCERVAARLQNVFGCTNWKLHTVRRAAGGMMERWESRWASSVRRYAELECVKVILPWSTPSMRFCTSELKSAPIASHLTKTFRGPVISVTGIRADESANRAKMPVSKSNPRLKGGFDWNPIIHWSKEEVFAKIAQFQLKLHEAYTLFGASRVSCAFCIMSAGSDLKAALKDDRNHELYRRMCRLEWESGFAFQGDKWLNDLTTDIFECEKTLKAKALMATRKQIESRIPKHLEFTAGWPNALPTYEEAVVLAQVRREIARLYNWENVKYTTPEDLTVRYRELIAQKTEKESVKAKKAERKLLKA